MNASCHDVHTETLHEREVMHKSIEILFKTCTRHTVYVQITYSCVCMCVGGSPACPCSDPHWGEAISMSHLWNTFPSPADFEEPPAYSHRGETIQCEYYLT